MKLKSRKVHTAGLMFSEFAVSTGSGKGGGRGKALSATCGYDAHYYPGVHAYGPPMDTRAEAFDNFKRTKVLPTFQPSGCKLDVFETTLQEASGDYTISHVYFVASGRSNVFTVKMQYIRRQWPTSGSIRVGSAGGPILTFDSRIIRDVPGKEAIEFTFDAETVNLNNYVHLMVARVRATGNSKPMRLERATIDAANSKAIGF